MWWTVVRGWRGRRGWSIWHVCTERIVTHPRVPPEVHAAVATVLVQKGEQAPVEALHRTGRFAKPLACTSISKSDATRRAFDSARNMACSFTARSRSRVSRSEAGVVQGRCGGSEFRQLLRRDGDSETAQRSERSYQCRFPSSSSGPKTASTASRRRSALRRLIENSASFFRASQRFDRFSVRMLCLEFEGDHDAPVEK